MRVNKKTEHLHPHARESHSSSQVTEIGARWEYLTPLPAWHPFLQQIVCIFTGRGAVEKTLIGLWSHRTNSSQFYRQGGLWHWHNTSLRTLLKNLPEFQIEPAISWIKFAILVNSKSSSTRDRGDAWVQIPWAQVKSLNQFRCLCVIPALLQRDGRVETGECTGGSVAHKPTALP